MYYYQEVNRTLLMLIIVRPERATVGGDGQEQADWADRRKHTERSGPADRDRTTAAHMCK